MHKKSSISTMFMLVSKSESFSEPLATSGETLVETSWSTVTLNVQQVL